MVDQTARIPDEFIQALLSRTDIVEVLSSYLTLKKTGSNYMACCPFHSEKTPSFSVNQNKQFYHCFGCGVSGDVIQFLKEHLGISFIEAVEQLAAKAGMQLPTLDGAQNNVEFNLIYNILSEATAFFEQQLRQHKLSDRAVQYLKNRGLTGLTAKTFRLGFAPPGWDNLLSHLAINAEQKELGIKAGLFIKKDPNKFYDRFRDRIMFPIRNKRGKVIGFGGRVIDANSTEPKYLNSPETVVFNKGYELYGYYEARQEITKQEAVIVVEGYMDVVALAQAGITNVVATLGTACTEQHIQNLFKTVPEIVFCFDGDSAGKKAAWRALELCLPLLDDKHWIKFIILNSGEDPDSFVRKYGGTAFISLLKQAISLPDYLFATLEKQVDLQQIDGRIQLANLITAQLAKLPDGMLKQMLYDRLGKLIDVDPAILQGKKAGEFKRPSFNKTIAVKKPTLNKHNIPVSPATRATALLLVNRDLLQVLPDLDGLDAVDFAGIDLFCAMARFLKINPVATDTEIQLALPENLVLNFIPAELRAIARIVPIEGVQAEFLGIIALLRRREKELIMDKLLLKAKQNALSEAEKLLLQQMLQGKGNK